MRIFAIESQEADRHVASVKTTRDSELMFKGEIFQFFRGDLCVDWGKMSVRREDSGMWDRFR